MDQLTTSLVSLYEKEISTKTIEGTQVDYVMQVWVPEVCSISKAYFLYLHYLVDLFSRLSALLWNKT